MKYALATAALFGLALAGEPASDDYALRCACATACTVKYEACYVKLGDQHTTCLGFKPFDSEGLIFKPLACKKTGFIPPAQGRWRIHGCHGANCTVIPDNRFYKCPGPNCSPCKDGSCIVIPGGKGPGCNVGPGGNKGPGSDKGPGGNKGPGGDKGTGGSDPPTNNKYTRPECPGPNCPPAGNKTMDSPPPVVTAGGQVVQPILALLGLGALVLL